jgi:hypothetical protein
MLPPGSRNWQLIYPHWNSKMFYNIDLGICKLGRKKEKERKES